MEALSYADILSLSHAIGEIYTALDLESLYSTIFRSIRDLIPYDLCSFNYVSLTPTSFLKIIPSSHDHNSIIKKNRPAFNKHIHEHPLISHFTSDTVFKTTDVASRNQFMATAIYNEYYRHLDTETQIGFSIPISQKEISIIALSRNNLDFSEKDRLILTLLKPHCVSALRNVTEFDRLRQERNLLHQGAEAQQQGVLLCLKNGLIICISELAREMCSRYFAATLSEGDSLPEALDRRFKMETGDAGTARVDRDAFIVEKDGKRLVIKLLNDVTTGDGILLMTENDPAAPIRNLQRYALSPRETEVLRWLFNGKTNMEIAVILGISKRTADKHMEHIFGKLGVETRAAAVSLIRNGYDLN